MIRRIVLAIALCLATAALTAVVIPVAFAHETAGYSHDSWTGVSHATWMHDLDLSSSLRLSELSLPGTHDSGAYNGMWGGDAVQCQSMNLETQLICGIRAWDIRLRNVEGHLMVHHGDFVQGFQEFGPDVLAIADDFLANHPREVILMRIKREGGDAAGFEDLVETALDEYPARVYRGLDDNPTLGAMRGKIVPLREFSDGAGIPWNSLNRQDFRLGQLYTLMELPLKWHRIRDKLVEADAIPHVANEVFVNMTSAWGVLPYFAASGHSDPGTDASNLWTGYYTGDLPSSWDGEPWSIEDFRVENHVGTDWVYYEGMNVLTMKYLREWATTPHHRAGIVYFNFPGHGAIESVINLNPYNQPPEADAGGPYVVDEGSPIAFSAAGSSDRDGDPLRYRWDYRADGYWETVWSDSPTVQTTFRDDFSGEAVVEVSDGYSSATDRAWVTVNNVAPTLTIASQSSHAVDEGSEAALLGIIADPGWNDAFTLVVDWGEGAPVTCEFPAGSLYPEGSKLFAVKHRYLDDNPTGTLADTYTVSVTLTDDDGGVDTGAMDVVVNNLPPIASIDTVQQPDPYIILPVVDELTFNGRFTDTGTQDTHTAVWNWGDGSSAAATVNQASGSGTVSGRHTFQAPGTYTVTLGVTDDDTAPATATWTVTVLSADQATTSLCSYVAALPNSSFVKVASQRRSALVSKLNLIVQVIKAADYRGAISSLRNDVRAKADGMGTNDWVIDPSARRAMCRMIDGTTAYMETLIIK